VTWND